MGCSTAVHPGRLIVPEGRSCRAHPRRRAGPRSERGARRFELRARKDTVKDMREMRHSMQKFKERPRPIQRRS